MSAWDRIRCIVFDFDGTLAESNELKRGTFFEIFSRWPGSESVVERVLRENPELDRHGIVPLVREGLLALGGPGLETLLDSEELIDAYASSTERKVSRCPAVPGAVAALEGLSAVYPLYIDSATPQDALARMVVQRGWSGFFREVLGGPTDKATNLAIIADREGLPAQEILLVGDGPPDQRAAQEFDCAFLGYQSQDPTIADHRALAPLAPLVRELGERSASVDAPR